MRTKVDVAGFALFITFTALIAFGPARGQAQAPPTAIQNDSAKWDYDDVDLIAGPVTLFLVCLDGQPTAACAQVPVSSGVVGPVAGTKIFTWRFPPLLAGPHTVAVQACTAGAAACSTGASLTFAFQALANPKNLRLGSGR